MMLDYLGWSVEATAVQQAVRAAVVGGHTTADLGGTLGTRAVGDWVARQVG
jgi:3-isopropylmalate dehydrogenase